MAKSLFVTPDDIDTGSFYAVVGSALHDTPVPIAGFAFQVLALNMPFLIGKLVMDPSHPAITLDLRYLTLMRVTNEYVRAQMPQNVVIPESILNALKGN